jgi:hypothetical protein
MQSFPRNRLKFRGFRVVPQEYNAKFSPEPTHRTCLKGANAALGIRALTPPTLPRENVQPRSAPAKSQAGLFAGHGHGHVYGRNGERRHCAGAVGPVAGTHAGATHWKPGLQSLFVWHGQAQRPTCVLHRCEMQVASV